MDVMVWDWERIHTFNLVFSDIDEGRGAHRVGRKVVHHFCTVFGCVLRFGALWRVAL